MLLERYALLIVFRDLTRLMIPTLSFEQGKWSDFYDFEHAPSAKIAACLVSLANQAADS